MSSNPPSISGILFYRRSQIDEVPFPLKGDERHKFMAVRNATGAAAPSALLIRALIAALSGKIQNAAANVANEVLSTVESTSRPGSFSVCALQGDTFYIPHGSPRKATYHLGVIAIADALVHASEAVDFLRAYRELLVNFQQSGLTVALKPDLLRAADELYYWLAYADQPVSDKNNRLAGMTIADSDELPSAGAFSLVANTQALTDVVELDTLLGTSPVPSVVPPPAAAPAPAKKKMATAKKASPTAIQQSATEAFRQKVSHAISDAIEPIVHQIETILAEGLTPLLIGPTDVGKTTAVRLMAMRKGWGFEEIAGLNSFADADIVGLSINGLDRPGVIARAFARARFGEIVTLFIDELARFNARALDVLLRVLLPVGADVARSMQIVTDVPVRVVETPLWRVDYAPYDLVQVVLAANNWGSKLDPALVRRTRPILVDFNDDVAALFDSPLKDVVRETWKAVAEGKTALPIGYQSLSLATGPKDIRVVENYLAQLAVIDAPAALGFRKIAQGLGLKV